MSVIFPNNVVVDVDVEEGKVVVDGTVIEVDVDVVVVVVVIFDDVDEFVVVSSE